MTDKTLIGSMKLAKHYLRAVRSHHRHYKHWTFDQNPLHFVENCLRRNQISIKDVTDEEYPDWTLELR